jgi:hypothetical protein
VARITYNSVNTGELAKEDHNVGVDDGTASTRLGKEVHPREAVRSSRSDLSLLHLGADLHDEELLTRLVGSSTPDALPDLECLQRLALVHQITR